MGHPVSNETKKAYGKQLARSAGDIQEYDEVGHVWPDRTRSTSPGMHSQES
jgi:hypothetical protein